MNRSAQFTLAALLLASGGCRTALHTADTSAKPNMVFILADDLAQGDLGCYGQKLIKTPNLDRMAAEGTRYTQAYSGTSVCAPSRTSLLTGLHMGHAPVRSNRRFEVENSPFGIGELPLPATTLTVAQLLKHQGYATACMGKWGMGQFDTTGSPLKKGFDHFFGYNSQFHAHSYFPTNLFCDDQRVELPENANGLKKRYAQDLIQKDVLGWVRRQQEHPFFLFYAVTLPHGPCDIDDLGEYAQREGWTSQQKTYAAMVTRLDTDVGALLALLKELKLDHNTLVMLAGDNGSSFNAQSEVGKFFDQSMGGKLRGFKRSMYEGGLRQAALARWPGIVPAGRISDEPWAFWDFLPTAAEFARAKLPAGFQPDGYSLVSFLKGGSAPTRDYFYWELHEGSTGSIQGIRFGDWKAVRNFTDVPTELYDLSKDSGETTNLAAQHPELVAKAEKLMSSARVNDANFPWRMRSEAKTSAAKAKKRAAGKNPPPFSSKKPQP
jgi:arylsulfatase A-like enzyme